MVVSEIQYRMWVHLWQADPSLLPEVEEDVMGECTKLGPIERLRVRYICTRLSKHQLLSERVRVSLSSCWVPDQKYHPSRGYK